jgi:hypothetical protein
MKPELETSGESDDFGTTIVTLSLTILPSVGDWIVSADADPAPKSEAIDVRATTAVKGRTTWIKRITILSKVI